MYRKIIIALDINSDYQYIIDKVLKLFDESTNLVLVNVLDLGLKNITCSYNKSDIDNKKEEAMLVLEGIKSKLEYKGFNNIEIYIGTGDVKKVLAHDVVDIFAPDLIVCGSYCKGVDDKRIFTKNDIDYIVHNVNNDIFIIKK